MMTQARLFLVLARPALVLLLALFAALGAGHAGGDLAGPGSVLTLLPSILVVTGFLVYAVAVNDLSDEAVDRANGLPRPLVTGSATRMEMSVVAALGAVLALAASVFTHSLWVTVAGLVFATVYSLPPFRVSARGLLASLLLPLGYVSVPFLAGVLSVRPFQAHDLLLLGGLYLGFVGRILLKDFRDVRGDALLGKRTALVRHGRGWTCFLSAAFWVVGSAAVFLVREPTPALVIGYALQAALAVCLIWWLAFSTGHRRDERLIAAIALVGRGQIVTLLVHYGLQSFPAWFAALNLAAFTVLVLGSALTMAKYGPAQRRSNVVRSISRSKGTGSLRVS